MRCVAFFFLIKSKFNLHYTSGITWKRVTSGGAHLRGLAPGQHSSEERGSGGDLLAILCPILRTRDLNLVPPTPTALS